MRILSTVFLSCIVFLFGCDPYTFTYIENQSDQAITLEFEYDSTEIHFDTVEISYFPRGRNGAVISESKEPEYCLRVWADRGLGGRDGFGGLLCNSRITLPGSFLDSVDVAAISSYYTDSTKLCISLDTLSDGKIRLNYQVPPGGKFEIGHHLGVEPTTDFLELHIAWPGSVMPEMSRIDLYGKDAILSSAQPTDDNSIFIIAVKNSH